MKETWALLPRSTALWFHCFSFSFHDDGCMASCHPLAGASTFSDPRTHARKHCLSSFFRACFAVTVSSQHRPFLLSHVLQVTLLYSYSDGREVLENEGGPNKGRRKSRKTRDMVKKEKNHFHLLAESFFLPFSFLGLATFWENTAEPSFLQDKACIFEPLKMVYDTRLEWYLRGSKTRISV